MNRSHTCASLLASSLLCATASAQVIFGAHASTTQPDRFSNGGYTNGPDAVFSGGEGFGAAAALLNGGELDYNGTGPWHRGLTRGTSQLSAPISGPAAPTLEAESRLTGQFSNVPFGSSIPIAGAGFAAAGALQAYQYTGATPTTLRLTYTLNADVFIAPGSVSAYPGVFFTVGVVGNVTFFSTDLGSLGEGGAFFYSRNGVDATDTENITETTGGSVTRILSMRFNVQPGDVFSIAARLGAVAVGGTNYAAATAVGEFDHPELITSLSAPTPGAGALLLLGSLSVLHRRR